MAPAGLLATAQKICQGLLVIGQTIKGASEGLDLPSKIFKNQIGTHRQPCSRNPCCALLGDIVCCVSFGGATWRAGPASSSKAVSGPWGGAGIYRPSGAPGGLGFPSPTPASVSTSPLLVQENTHTLLVPPGSPCPCPTLFTSFHVFCLQYTSPSSKRAHPSPSYNLLISSLALMSI